ncbi:hydroperoxide isomerase ALOXE3-like [Aptenodytes patagonicus]|uniref:hydroperoxide isomerase ALOXE3-like n=1 Tax=Aptenodytes patagonicus TaxID=9234 RepID=UPI003F9EDF5D
MAVYKVKVATGDILEGGTNNSISITLVGSRGERRRTTINYWLLPGTEKDMTMRCEQDLGRIVLIRLHKWRLFLEDAWFCRDIRVMGPDGTLYRFPCYQWLEGVTTVEVRESSGKKMVDDELEILKEHRQQELKARQEALLVPHFHFNTLAQSILINPGGIIDKASGVTCEGMLLIIQQGLEKATYTSLCLPDDMWHRGVVHLPSYHYRDDAMSLWEAIERWDKGLGGSWWWSHGFISLGRTSSGIPSSLRTVAELSKFLTMAVFTCSAQHAAINNGQCDLGAFLPNAPSSMRHPPPAEKGKAFLQHFLTTVPEVDTTANILVALILLSSCLSDVILLGQYLEERFTEVEPHWLIRAFQGQLEEIQDCIEERNHWAKLRYNYMNPLKTENSISDCHHVAGQITQLSLSSTTTACGSTSGQCHPPRNGGPHGH